MLEHLAHPQVLADLTGMGSDNLRGGPDREPDNQQERLIDTGWVVGFVDGEGCFSIGLTRQPDRANRKGYRTGFQVSHDFVVTQGAKSVGVLHELQAFFGVGRVYLNSRHDNHREHLYRYSVCRRSDLLSVVIPFFRRHPLRSAKQRDFEGFARCVELMGDHRHTTVAGLIEIVQIMQTMNRQKPRDVELRILRDHTSDVRDIG
jgi:hypothetical protein